MKPSVRANGWLLIVLMGCILSGCSGYRILEPPAADFKATADESVVFGEIRIIDAYGKRIDHPVPRNKSDKVTAMTFFNVESKERCAMGVFRKDGYFMNTIPPGRYQLSQVICQKADIKNHKMIPCSRKCTQYRKPTRIFFEVLPERATYIGTLLIKLSERSVTKVKRKEEIVARPAPGRVVKKITRTPYAVRMGYVSRWGCADEFESRACDVFREMAPDSDLPVKRLMVVEQKPL